jgi:hypothetical protein
MTQCVVCKANKCDSDFYRVNVPHPRCKTCCGTTRWCETCSQGRAIVMFSQMSRKCDVCLNESLFGQESAKKEGSLSPRIYVRGEIEKHNRWLVTKGLCNVNY